MPGNSLKAFFSLSGIWIVTGKKITFYAGAVSVIALFLFLQFLRSGEPLGLDQGLFACIGRWINDGWLPYRDLWDHKPPLIFFLYGLAIDLFGRKVTAIWWMEGIWMALGGIAIFLLGRRLWNRWVGLLSALFFVVGLWSPEWEGYWSRAQSETFLSLPMIAAAYMVYVARERPVYALGAGLMMGAASLLKLPAVAVAAAWPWFWMPGRRTGEWLFRCVLLAMGVVIMWVLAALYFWHRGGLSEFLEAVFVFPQIFHDYTAQAGFLWPIASRVVTRIALGIPVMATAGLVGICCPGSRRDLRLLWLGPWVVVSVLVIIGQAQAANYHFLIAIPGLALSAAVGVFSLVRLASNARISVRVLATVSMVFIMFLAGLEVKAWRELHADNWAFQTGKIDRTTYLERQRRGMFRPAVEEEMAGYVRSRTRTGDGILIWGLAPGVYFLSDRHPVTRYPFHHLFLTEARLSLSVPGLENRRRRFLEGLNNDPPAMILVGRRDRNGFERLPSDIQMENFPAFHRFVAANYRLNHESQFFLVYDRIDKSRQSG